MKILITGYAGFVGRHFVERLDIKGNTLHLIDKDKNMTAQKFFNSIVSDQHYDLVIHLAAMVGGRAKIDGDPLAIAENLAIDSDMFRWAMRKKPTRIVYFSSSAAYPVRMQMQEPGYQDWLLHENDIALDLPELPDQTYGWAKLTGEILAQHAEQAGIRVHVFRPFSGYGSDQALDYPFPSFIERAKQRRNPFEIWGDGWQTRDFIHIEDIVEAVLKAIDEDVPGPVNLGWGRPTPFNELAGLICEQAGYRGELELLHHLDKPVGCLYRVADNSKMLSFYEPKITLEEGIERALAWI